MKTAYELAMERLNKSTPTVKLTAEQKARIAELESKYKAKIAEEEIHFREKIEKAASAGDQDKSAQLEQQLASQRKKLQAKLDEQKAAVREGKP
jgi:hypothetical protein